MTLTILKRFIVLLNLILSFSVFAVSEPLNANWMAQIPNDRILNQLIIPGTHDSGTYGITPDSLFSLSSDDVLPLWLETISNLLPKSIIRPIVAKWSKTQPDSLTQQLNAGIRYFDMRVCHFTNGSNIDDFYLCHTLLGETLSDALTQIQQFALSHPDEIIILDINHIYNIKSDDDETQLMQLLSHNLSGVAVANTYTPTSTIGAIRASKRNVIILMDADHSITDPNAEQFFTHWVWHQSSIESPWLDVSSSADLKQKMDTEVAFRASNYQTANNFFVYQFIKTENTNQVINGILNPTQYPDNTQSYEKNVDNDLLPWLNQYIATYGFLPINIVIEDWFTDHDGLVVLAKQYDTETIAIKSQETVDPTLLAQLKKYHLFINAKSNKQASS